MLSSALHSEVDSAIAEEAPTNAMASSAVSAVRPIILIAFTLFSLLGEMPRLIDLAPEFPSPDARATIGGRLPNMQINRRNKAHLPMRLGRRGFFTCKSQDEIFASARKRAFSISPFRDEIQRMRESARS